MLEPVVTLQVPSHSASLPCGQHQIILQSNWGTNVCTCKCMWKTCPHLSCKSTAARHRTGNLV